MKIEPIAPANRDEIIDLLAEAFTGHALLPANTSEKKARLLWTALLDAFENAPDASRFGIRQDGRLVCLAFVFDAAFEPAKLAVLRLLFRIIRVAGWRMTRAFTEVMADKIPGNERRLELLLLAVVQ